MIQINSIACDKSKRGTGTVSCMQLLKEAQSVYKVPRSWRLNKATDTYDKEYVLSKIQDGTFVPFLNTLEFIDNTPERTTKEYTGGRIRTIRNGKPMFSMEFDNGPLWHAAAYSNNSYGDSSVIIIDSAGTNHILDSVDGTEIMGLPVGDFNFDTFKYQQGDETFKSILQFQIIDEEAYNRRSALISAEAIGANLNTEVGVGIVDAIVEGTASAGDPITVTVNADLNEGFGVEALVAANFRVVNTANNAVIAINTVTDGAQAGTYVITPTTPLTEDMTIKVYLYDATNSVYVAVVDETQFYKGESAVITVAA